MTRQFRLAIGSLIVVAVGCAGAVPQITAEQRVQLEVLALQQACAACLAKLRLCTANPEVIAVCAAFERPEPIITSGDSGPPSLSPPSGDAGNGVRSIGGTGGQ